MTGDFTRDSFEAAKRFRRVLLQQGRVQLDADFNEQSSILLRQSEILTTSLLGRFGGPRKIVGADNRWTQNDGFLIGPGASPNATNDFTIGAGLYYVDGILCENFATQTFSTQEDFLATPDAKLPSTQVLIYLELFERAVAAAQDDAIAEPALEGLDTAARSRVVWQVKTLAPPAGLSVAPPVDDGAWNDWLNVLDPPGRGLLRARANSDVGTDSGPCIVPVSSAFRGEDNQLYRVEIHEGGALGEATFKWSRENGSVIFPIETLSGGAVTVTTLGRDRRFGLQPGDWVEITDDGRDVRRDQVLPLFQVDSVKRDERLVVLKNPTGVAIPEYEAGDTRHPLLRRWDGGDAAKIAEATDAGAFTLLENGVQVQFVSQVTPRYRSGDYWLIPARVALADILWPFESPGKRKALPPRGITRHFAPLAFGPTTNPNGIFNDVRRLFGPLGT
jgi:hypothetical protein